MNRRICLVTGANGTMGRVIATELARRGATVVVVCRTVDQGAALQRELIAATTNERVDFLAADLADQASIRRLVETFNQRYEALHVLVNNAGAHFHERRLSPDGLELHLAVNHLAPFLLTQLLVGKLEAGAPARVVNVASEMIADTRPLKLGGRPRPARLDLDDLQSERRYRPMEVYGSAKLALVMCGYALARRLAGRGVTVNALHPGVVATEIVDKVAPRWARPLLGVVKAFMLSPEEGARTTLFLASAPEVESITGQYFIDQKPHPTPPLSYDEALQEKLWQASARLVGLDRTGDSPAR